MSFSLQHHRTALTSGRRAACAPVRPGQQGVILIEVVVSLLLFSLGILAVVGLQAVGIKTVSEAKYRSDASLIANQTIGRMWTDQLNLTAYAKTTDLTALPDGKQTVAVDGTAVTITITWKPPELGADDAPHSFQTFANIHGG
ncbi:MAG: prepilin-type cleavage/methylation domain-containing protein [Pseudomonadota bacterium]|nr:prepilin-type cleavage/methylation domain-containing protein [Pseudomonadota bacterium]